MVRQLGDRIDIAGIVKAYLKEALDDDWERRVNANGRGLYPPWGRPHEDLQFLESEIEAARHELRERLYDHQASIIDEVVEQYNVPPELRGAVAHGVLQARLEALEVIKQRTLGHFDPIVRPEVPPREPSVAASVDKDDSPLLSTVLPTFLAAMSEDAGWSGQTRAQNEATYDLFLQVCGDKPVRSYERRHLAEFYNLLRKLPSLYSKSPQYRGKTMEEIAGLAELEGAERLAMRTIKRHFAALQRLFGHLKRQGLYSMENPASDFEFPTTVRANQRRQMWEGESLVKLFSSPVWSGCKSEARRSAPGAVVIQDERYWLPILGLFHGNRLEEFAQLRREDVRQDQGVWFFDIHDKGERQLKNEQSRRRVPVHPAVLDLRFIDYVASVAQRADQLVFPNLKPGGPDKKLGYYFTKWWTTYRRAIEVYEEGLDYHSFRHGVTTKLYGASVSDAIVDELTGHEGKSTSRIVYKKELPLPVLYEAIAKVWWPEVDGLLSGFDARGQK
jgi:integrase